VTGFRVVVAVPPPSAEVTIENLGTTLLSYFREHGSPEALDAISSSTQIEDVTDIEIESVDIGRDGIHVAGRGYVDLGLSFGGEADSIGSTAFDSLPFAFDLDLDANLSITQVKRLSFDTSGYASESLGVTPRRAGA
jgi:hypothetical protein